MNSQSELEQQAVAGFGSQVGERGARCQQWRLASSGGWPAGRRQLCLQAGCREPMKVNPDEMAERETGHIYPPRNTSLYR